MKDLGITNYCTAAIKHHHNSEFLTSTPKFLILNPKPIILNFNPNK